MQSRTTIRRAIALIAGLCLACVIVGTLAVILRPRTFTERVDAIGYSLAQQGVAYQQIYINRTWPDTVNTVSYGANLIVIVPKQGSIGGRIDCKTMDSACEIAFPKLGIDRLPIPDLTVTSEMPLLTWLEARITAMKAGRLPWE